MLDLLSRDSSFNRSSRCSCCRHVEADTAESATVATTQRPDLRGIKERPSGILPYDVTSLGGSLIAGYIAGVS